ncbi:MAG: TraR/DksA family transcriptional regulator [Planctomycetota bacterium]|jgi:RNA polymerase-binding protein DksA
MEEKKTNESKLTPAEIEEFRALLLAKRDEILKNVISMENEALHRQRSDLSSMPIHMADIGTDNYGQEFALGLMDSERKLMKEIDKALDRIENGTYGICEGTGQPIPKERLEAIPWARYCAAYASLLEKGFVKKEYSLDESDYDGEIGKEEDEDSEESAEDESH